MATDRRSDPGRIKHESTDLQRDIAAKGGPATGIGDAQNRQAASPSDDLQTKAAAGSKKQQRDEPSRESQTKRRSGNRTPGSNH
jgi:hypothetical protein